MNARRQESWRRHTRRQRLVLYTVLPNREGDDFVTHRVLLSAIDNPLLAQVKRTALIMALETHFGRVQIFGDELPFAKYV